MNKQKFFDFLNKILYSSLFLWAFLIILKKFNLKPEININLFFFLSIFLFLGLYLKQILIFFILNLNRINIYLGISKKRVKIESENLLYLFLLFIIRILKFLRGFPRFLKFIFTNYSFWLGLCILGIFLDIFVFKFISDLLILFLTCLWILSVHHFKFKSQISVILALILLFLCPFLLIYKKEFIAEKTANWIFMFLLIGLTQIFIAELKNKKEDKNEALKN